MLLVAKREKGWIAYHVFELRQLKIWGKEEEVVKGRGVRVRVTWLG